jgi:hypothetical protein
MQTLAPTLAASIAAAMPAGPPPIIVTSYLYIISHLNLFNI